MEVSKPLLKNGTVNGMAAAVWIEVNDSQSMPW